MRFRNIVLLLTQANRNDFKTVDSKGKPKTEGNKESDSAVQVGDKKQSGDDFINPEYVL